MRWWQEPGRSKLHRVAAVSFDDDDRISGQGATACGLFIVMRMPGMFSRKGAMRCWACCSVANVPNGRGAPFNEGIDA